MKGAWGKVPTVREMCKLGDIDCKFREKDSFEGSQLMVQHLQFLLNFPGDFALIKLYV